jgi:hypothetical protein
MKNGLAQAGCWMVRIMILVLLLAGSWPTPVFAEIGDSKAKIEAQFGAADLVQDAGSRIWHKEDWKQDQHGIAYGYLNNKQDWQETRWFEYNEQGRVVKETVLFGKRIRIRNFEQYFGEMHAALTANTSIVFTVPFYSGERLGAVVPTKQGKLNYIQFFTVPDQTKINMHTQISGFEITAITAPTVKANLAGIWRQTDNYFRNNLYFSEPLMPRAMTDMIVIHHTAKDDMSLADIHELHLTKGWAGIAYHKVILADGSIQEGRPEQMIGAHALGANPRSIGIVVDGDFEEKPPTKAQMDTLVRLTGELMDKYHIPLAHVVPHREVTPGTSCPGAKFPWAELVMRLQARKQN